MIVRKSALVPYSAQVMFDLVNDVESYPKFLPWCRSAKVVARHDNEMQASIEIAHGVLSKTFATRNRFDKPNRIDIELVEGPFRHLEGLWQFQALDENACKVCLDMEFEFSNKLVSVAFGPVFTQIANRMVDAFCQRAVDVHGRR